MQHFAPSFNYPKIARAKPESIRQFLNLFDQYINKVTAKAQQLCYDTMGSEATLCIALKFCVDIKFLKSSISLGLTPDVLSYDFPINTALR